MSKKQSSALAECESASKMLRKTHRAPFRRHIEDVAWYAGKTKGAPGRTREALLRRQIADGAWYAGETKGALGRTRGALLLPPYW